MKDLEASRFDLGCKNNKVLKNKVFVQFRKKMNLLILYFQVFNNFDCVQ